jgi:hypothetical protein
LFLITESTEYLEITEDSYIIEVINGGDSHARTTGNHIFDTYLTVVPKGEGVAFTERCAVGGETGGR